LGTRAYKEEMPARTSVSRMAAITCSWFDSIALAVLVIGIGVVMLLALSI